MCKYERNIHVPLKNEILREEKAGVSDIFLKYNFKTFKKPPCLNLFLSLSSEEQIRCLVSEHLFQIAETVKFNENVLLKMSY